MDYQAIARPKVFVPRPRAFARAAVKLLVSLWREQFKLHTRGKLRFRLGPGDVQKCRQFYEDCLRGWGMAVRMHLREGREVIMTKDMPPDFQAALESMTQ